MTGQRVPAAGIRAGMVAVGDATAGPDLDGVRFAVVAAGEPVPSLDGGTYVTVVYVADDDTVPRVWTTYVPQDAFVVPVSVPAGGPACGHCGMTGGEMPAAARWAGVPAADAICCQTSG